MRLNELWAKLHELKTKGFFTHLWKLAGKKVIMFTGEVFIATIPLISNLTVKTDSRHVITLALCDRNLTNCAPLMEDLPLAEMNVLAVVVCGLGILSLFKASFSEAHRNYTVMTFVVGVASLGLLTIGSLLYALTSANVDDGSAKLTWWVLGLSLAAAFYLAVEEGWLHALSAYRATQVV